MRDACNCLLRNPAWATGASTWTKECWDKLTRVSMSEDRACGYAQVHVVTCCCFLCRQVKELGRGCFGSVWLAKWRGVEVALKEMLHQVRARACTFNGRQGVRPPLLTDSSTLMEDERERHAGNLCCRTGSVLLYHACDVWQGCLLQGADQQTKRCTLGSCSTIVVSLIIISSLHALPITLCTRHPDPRPMSKLQPSHFDGVPGPGVALTTRRCGYQRFSPFSTSCLNHQGTDSNPAEVFSEAEKLASLRHPCVMAFYGIVTSPDAYATVSEYICHGSLRGGLMKIKKKVGRQRSQMIQQQNPCSWPPRRSCLAGNK